MKLKKRHISLMLFCGYIAAVAYICFARPESIPEFKPDLFGIPIDKIVHFTMFLPFPPLAYTAFCPARNEKWLHLIILAVIFFIGTGLALGTEKIQGLSEFRSYEIEDFYADVMGMEVSTVITAILIIFKRRSDSPERK